LALTSDKVDSQLLVDTLYAIVTARRSLGVLEAWEIFPEDLELGDPLGSGRFGDVFQGMWCGTPVAVKATRGGDGGGNGPAAADMAREAAFMLPLRHNNVLRLLGVLLGEQPALLLLELMEACLIDVLRGAAFMPPREQLHAAMEVAAGLEYIHHHGVVHCDLAARNVLVSSAGVLKIADFGMARREGSPGCALAGQQVCARLPHPSAAVCG